MKYSELTDEKLVAIKTKVDKILEGRKNGRKRRVSDSEVIDIFKKNHDKFVEMHTLLGGVVYKGDEFAGYLNFIREVNLVLEDGSYTTPYYSVSSDSDEITDGTYTSYVEAMSVFNHRAFYDADCWGDCDHPDEHINAPTVSKWIVVDGNVPSFKYIRELATKLCILERGV